MSDFTPNRRSTIGRNAEGKVLSRGAFAEAVRGFNTGASLTNPPTSSELLEATTSVKALADAQLADLVIADLQHTLMDAHEFVSEVTFSLDDYGYARIDEVGDGTGNDLRDGFEDSSSIERVCEAFFDSGEDLPTEHERVTKLEDGRYRLNLDEPCVRPQASELEAARMTAQRAERATQAGAHLFLVETLGKAVGGVGGINVNVESVNSANWHLDSVIQDDWNLTRKSAEDIFRDQPALRDQINHAIRSMEGFTPYGDGSRIASVSLQRVPTATAVARLTKDAAAGLNV